MSERSATRKLALAARILRRYVSVRRNVHRQPLPQLVARLGAVGVARPAYPPRALGAAVHRVLGMLPRRPTCLVQSLVLYRLLREQDDEPALVIGLPSSPRDERAHAWVESGGLEIGPPPGRNGHAELARYR